jgi:ElaA protein
MVQGKWFPQGSDIAVPLALRREIFARGRDALDEEAQQVLVYDGETPVGTARLWWKEGAFCLGELGVVSQHRGKGFGDLLTRLALYKVLVHQGRQVRLTAPLEVVSFFARYGFAPDGEDGREGGMVSMSLRAEDIRLEACGGGCRGCQAGS